MFSRDLSLSLSLPSSATTTSKDTLVASLIAAGVVTA